MAFQAEGTGWDSPRGGTVWAQSLLAVKWLELGVEEGERGSRPRHLATHPRGSHGLGWGLGEHKEDL